MIIYKDLYIIVINIFFGIQASLIYSILFFKNLKFKTLFESFFSIIESIYYIKILEHRNIDYKNIFVFFIFLGFYISNVTIKKLLLKIVPSFYNNFHIFCNFIIKISKPDIFILILKYMKSEKDNRIKKKELF